MDCDLPGSSVHGILQARILEWVAMPSSKGSSWPRDRTHVFRIAGRFFTQLCHLGSPNFLPTLRLYMLSLLQLHWFLGWFSTPQASRTASQQALSPLLSQSHQEGPSHCTMLQLAFPCRNETTFFPFPENPFLSLNTASLLPTSCSAISLTI